MTTRRGIDPWTRLLATCIQQTATIGRILDELFVALSAGDIDAERHHAEVYALTLDLQQAAQARFAIAAVCMLHQPESRAEAVERVIRRAQIGLAAIESEPQ